MRAVAYIRVSSLDQVDGHCCGFHLLLCLEGLAVLRRQPLYPLTSTIMDLSYYRLDSLCPEPLNA